MSEEPYRQLTDQLRPAPGGCQIQSATAGWQVGTLGATVLWDNQVVGISNAHVLIEASSIVYQPDIVRLDLQLNPRIGLVGGVSIETTYDSWDDLISRESATYSMWDFGWFTPDPPDPEDPEDPGPRTTPAIAGIYNGDEPLHVRNAEEGMHVRWIGASTQTVGEYIIKDSDVVMVGTDAKGKVFGLHNFLRLMPVEGKPRAQKGDSGSALVDDDNFVVGLLTTVPPDAPFDLGTKIPPTQADISAVKEMTRDEVHYERVMERDRQAVIKAILAKAQEAKSSTCIVM
ncbi:hypothetical protein [Streptomyces sp. 1222.5]|uniref:hypothetical protein n=1 Tax=Streptomyces sp. 1222.5 TaxID=1881026 RepID=UPI003D7451B4